MTEKRIVVAEDEHGAAEMMQLLLELEGYRVVLASNGREALEQVARVNPHVLITDFMMPGLTGGQLGARLRAQQPNGARLPILMMSALPELEIRRHFGDYDAFVQKPFHIEHLTEIVRRLLTPARKGPEANSHLVHRLRWETPTIRRFGRRRRLES